MTRIGADAVLEKSLKGTQIREGKTAEAAALSWGRGEEHTAPPELGGQEGWGSEYMHNLKGGIHSRGSSLACLVRKYHVGKRGLWPQFLMAGSDVCSSREEYINGLRSCAVLEGSVGVWEDRLVEENSRIQME